jgi:plasmid stabilization system protein ParE
MGRKIVWSDTAISDLKSICEYIAKDNPDAAKMVGEGIVDHMGIPRSSGLLLAAR